MLELLKEKRAQLESALAPANHEQEIVEQVAKFEADLRAKYAEEDKEHKDKVLNQIEIVDELIAEQEKVINSTEIQRTETINEEE